MGSLRILVLCFAMTAFVGAVSAAHVVDGGASPEPPRPCSQHELKFHLDNAQGEFDGMSQSGTLLIVENVGQSFCTVPARPRVIFTDADGQPLRIDARTAMGMVPGPVLLPLSIPAGGKLVSEARWVSSDAYGGNNCLAPAFLVARVGDAAFRVAFAGQLCGPAGKHVTYSLSPWK